MELNPPPIQFDPIRLIPPSRPSRPRSSWVTTGARTGVCVETVGSNLRSTDLSHRSIGKCDRVCGIMFRHLYRTVTHNHATCFKTELVGDRSGCRVSELSETPMREAPSIDGSLENLL